MTTKAAVGPETFTVEPPERAMTMPAMIAVYKPCCGATPTAMANAMDRGRAMTPTVRPARMLAR